MLSKSKVLAFALSALMLVGAPLMAGQQEQQGKKGGQQTVSKKNGQQNKNKQKNGQQKNKNKQKNGGAQQ
jgi:hypothetical protein